jgi:hypothetical protein
MKGFKRGLYVGIGFLAIVLPFVLGIGIVQAINDTQLNINRQSFAPQTSTVYIFEKREVDSNIETLVGKASGSIDTVIKNYMTADNKLVDIVIFKTTGLSTTQQTTLQNAYPDKIVTGLDKMPAPYTPPAPVIKKDIIKE